MSRNPVDPRRIVRIAAPLAALVALGVLAYRPHARIPKDALAPWIPLPPTGTDASRPEVRTALLGLPDGWESVTIGATTPSLAESCGIDDVQAPPHYRAIVDAGLVPPPRLRREIDLVVQGASTLVRIRDLDLALPMPNAAAEWHAAPVTTKVTTASLEPLRAAWNSAAWRAPQSTMQCTDAARMRLEACVDGRYAVRRISCDRQSDVQPMLRALRALPTPPRGGWQPP